VNRDADEIVCLSLPTPFWTPDRYYKNFRERSDQEIIALLTNSTPVHRIDVVSSPLGD
jgi:predicted phosphoribosyltransferase